jgi:hypothetical protein
MKRTCDTGDTVVFRYLRNRLCFEEGFCLKTSSALDAVIRLDGWYLINLRITDIRPKSILSCALSPLNPCSRHGSSLSSSKISKAFKRRMQHLIRFSTHPSVRRAYICSSIAYVPTLPAIPYFANSPQHISSVKLGLHHHRYKMEVLQMRHANE